MQLNQPSSGHFTALMSNGAQAECFASMVERTPDPDQPLSSSRAAFRIPDTLSFADAISRWIPGFTHGVQGPCVYRPTTLLTKATVHEFGPPKEGEDPEAHLRAMNNQAHTNLG